ncbi:hypothetical protein AB3Z07_28615 (plasmid) [Metabacillus halosaccharovorans]|nr:hypothetical protein [Metabacillus halosaccharovorans]
MNVKPFKSVDLFIPSKLFVIEYDGVHTHRNKKIKMRKRAN